MKRPSKGKFPKKPGLKKYRKAPKMPKGGIKTEAQLNGYEKRKKDYAKHKADVNAQNGKTMKAYNDACKKITDKYKADMKKYDTFQKRVAKVKTL